jgi:hypothetical protein
MTSGTKMHKGYLKLRFLSDRRRFRKVRLCEDAIGKVSKKKSLVMTDAEWRSIDKLLTPYYCRRVELQCSRALHENIKFQLTSTSDEQVTVAMWFEHSASTMEDDLADDDDVDDGGSESSDTENSGPVVATFSSDSSSESGDGESDEDGPTLGPGSHRVISSDSDAISECESGGEDDFTPFRYRRIRHVTFTLQGDHFVMECDCGYFDRTNVPCRHILRLLREILGHWGLESQRWHMRLLKKLYYDVLTTLRPIRGSHKQTAQCRVSAAAVRQWLEGKEATQNGVPRAGVVDVHGADNGEMDGNGNCEMDGNGNGDSGPSRKTKKKSTSKKSAARSEDECLQKFQTIMYACKKNPEKRSSFYDSMCEWQEADGRSCVHSAVGAPESARTRGLADIPRGSKKRKRGNDDAVPKYKGYEGDAAIKKIRKNGAKEGWIVELYPATGHEQERWFAKVQDGSTYVNAEGEVMMKELIWLELGSLTKKAKGMNAEPIDIMMVKAYGERSFFTL